MEKSSWLLISKCQIQSKRIEENRKKIQSIAETVIFCGRQGIFLRGHHDRKTVQEEPLGDYGKFLALLQFQMDSGYKILADHFKSGSHHKNALYTSKTVQNESINVCGDIIRSNLLDNIRAAGAFSIMADEATDAGNKEQLAICIRYVNRGTREIVERFMGFSECVTGVTGVTGEAIADCLQHLSDWQLPASMMCGQAYVGAGAMAGKTKGAAARIAERYPKAVYTHCAAHVINLCVVKCNIPKVRNAMDIGD